MAPNYANIADVVPGRTNWKIIVRVMLLWFVPHFKNKDEIISMDMILMDEQVMIDFIFIYIVSYN